MEMRGTTSPGSSAFANYPQAAFPCIDLIQTGGRRNRGDVEYELLDILPRLKSIEINTWGLAFWPRPEAYRHVANPLDFPETGKALSKRRPGVPR
jgi:hypothetical protein